jgi:hypothetical protein
VGRRGSCFLQKTSGLLVPANQGCKKVVYLGAFLPLLSPNRSSLNLLHSVKNRAAAAIQVCFSSRLRPVFVLILSLSFRSLQNNYSEKYEHNICLYSPPYPYL